MKLTFGAMTVPANASLGQPPGRPGPDHQATFAVESESCPSKRVNGRL